MMGEWIHDGWGRRDGEQYEVWLRFGEGEGDPVELPVKGSERYEKLVADVSAVTNRPILFVTRYVDAVLAALREGE